MPRTSWSCGGWRSWAPEPRFTAVTDVDDVDAFAARIGGPIVVKTVRGGYDGRGVTLARDISADFRIGDSAQPLVWVRVAELGVLAIRACLHAIQLW